MMFKINPPIKANTSMSATGFGSTGGTTSPGDPAGAVAAGGELTEPVDDPGRPEDLPPDSELFDEFDSAVYETSPIAPRPADEEPLAPAGV